MKEILIAALRTVETASIEAGLVKAKGVPAIIICIAIIYGGAAYLPLLLKH